MEVIRLPWGEIAPSESDCVHVEETPAGEWVLDTSALLACADDEEAESETTFASDPYDSYDAAEAAGLAIAAEQCATTVFVSRARAGAQ